MRCNRRWARNRIVRPNALNGPVRVGARNASLTPAAAHLARTPSAPPPPARLPAPVHRSEVIHGRFAMLGVTGAWAQENLGEGPWFDAGAACTPSACEINYLGQEAFGNTPNAFAIIVVVEILTFGYAEALRTGVVDSAFPELTQGDAYPGGRFDPLNQLGMDNLEELKLKELKHCRLAMFAWLGLIAQAAATKQGPIANWSAHVSDPAAVNIVSVFQNR